MLVKICQCCQTSRRVMQIPRLLMVRLIASLLCITYTVYVDRVVAYLCALKGLALAVSLSGEMALRARGFVSSLLAAGEYRDLDYQAYAGFFAFEAC